MQRLFAHKTIASLFMGATGLVAAVWAWGASAHIRGHAVARIDVARGSYQVLAIGLPPPWRDDWSNVLHEQYGAKVRSVAGCIVSDWLADYVDAYDTTMFEAMSRKFNRDVFRDSTAEAVQRFWAQKKAAR